MGDYIGALEAQRSASQWEDSLSSADVNESLLALEAEMWSEKKEHSLQIAEKNQELQAKEAERLQEKSDKVATQRNLLIILLLFILLAGGALYYLNIKQKQTRLQHKISELRFAALRSQMNPHFIFNALGSMQLLINTGKSMEANMYLSKFARLLRMILENSANSRLSLEEEIEALRLYVELEALRFKFQYEIKIDPELNVSEIQIPGMLIQPFIENAIKHGITGKKEAGKLELEFRIDGDQLVCIIQDNGIGRKASAKIQRNAEGHRSRGMQLIEKQLALIRPQRPDRLQILDREDDQGEALGTRIEIRLPLLSSEE